MVHRQPRSGRSLLKTYIKAYSAIFKNKVTLFVLISGCFRFFSGFTIGYFVSEYFGFFSSDTDKFAVLNALALSIGGLISNLVSGYLCDRFSS